MNILMISTNVLLTDGITSYMKESCRSLCGSDIHFHFLVQSGSNTDVVNDLRDNHFTIHECPNRVDNLFGYVRKLNHICRENRFDVVHINTSSSLSIIELTVCRLYRIPKIILHSHSTQCNHKVLHYIFRPLAKACATDYVSCGYDAGKWLFGKADFTIVHNARDCQLFTFHTNDRIRLRKNLGLKDEIALLMVGNLTKIKNQKFGIDLVESSLQYSSCPDLKLYLVGMGCDFELLNSYVKQKHLENYVKFLGVRDDVHILLSAMDVMLLPSLAEGLPTVVIESQLNGLPCIISDCVTIECVMTSFTDRLSLSDKKLWLDKIIEYSRLNRDLTASEGLSVLKQRGYVYPDAANVIYEMYRR